MLAMWLFSIFARDLLRSAVGGSSAGTAPCRFPLAASCIYAANLRLALLPVMLPYVWTDKLRRYSKTLMAAAVPSPAR